MRSEFEKLISFVDRRPDKTVTKHTNNNRHTKLRPIMTRFDLEPNGHDNGECDCDDGDSMVMVFGEVVVTMVGAP